MFGSVGGAEILMVLVLALLLFGPRSLPKVGRTIGRAMGEMRRAANDFRSTLEREVHVEEFKDVRSGLKSVEREIADAAEQDAEAPTEPREP